jgi:hypothetical protein
VLELAEADPECQQPTEILMRWLTQLHSLTTENALQAVAMEATSIIATESPDRQRSSGGFAVNSADPVACATVLRSPSSCEDSRAGLRRRWKREVSQCRIAKATV